jgi:hypothetical protein
VSTDWTAQAVVVDCARSLTHQSALAPVLSDALAWTAPIGAHLTTLLAKAP